MSEHADNLFPSDEEMTSSPPEKKSSKKRSRSKTVNGEGSSSKKSLHEQKAQKVTVKDLFGTDSEDEAQAAEQSHASQPFSTSLRDETNKNYILCEKCEIEIPKIKFKYHLRTNAHKSRCLLSTDFKNIDIVATAFKNRIVTYRLNASQEDEYITPEAFLRRSKTSVIKLLQMSLKKNKCLKVNFELFAFFTLPKSGNSELKSFNMKYKTIFNNTNLSDFYMNLIIDYKNEVSEFEQCESGWSFESISHLEINISKYCPLRGGSYTDLPASVKNTKSCLNIKNIDDHCFLWSVVAALFPAKCNPCRTSSYPHYSQVFKIDRMSFPPSFKDIKIFENDNSDISINVYGLDQKNNVTGPLYVTNIRKLNHVNLLYFEKNGKGHFCLIKDLARLVHRQVSRHKSRLYLCENCLQCFSCQSKYNGHNCSKVITMLPNKHSTLEFKHFERKQKMNFVIYADFESLLKDYDDNNRSHCTQKLKLHQPSCFGYYVCCSHDESLNKYVTYRGSDCAKRFIECLIEDVTKIDKILSTNNPMIPLNEEQEFQYHNCANCHICNELLFYDRVRDHDHITGEFRGAAHSHCNLKLRVVSFVPVIFHNLSGYDCHLFIKELSDFSSKIDIIPKSKEKYLTVMFNIENLKTQIKFVDSFQFLNSSLDVLSKNLCDKDLINFSKQFRTTDQFNMIRCKGIYPYDYINSWDKYEETKLPEKEYFYNSLKSEHISDDDYDRAKKIWHTFDIHSLGEYTDLYLKCDVILLCDIFENFRKNCLHYYHLDPAYYVSSPGLSWDAMLLYTGIKLELIDDLEMYQMLEKGIRGGLAQCSLRHATANNKYLPNHNKSLPSTYLLYLDCNNLYGYAMTKKMPVSEFRFLNKEEISNFNLQNTSEESDYGYILEVDMSYPDDLHDGHSDLPFAAEKFIPPGGKTPKLIANLYDKYNYVIHYDHLKQCLKNGLLLKKINRILTFRQSPFLRKYIDLNTTLRKTATSDFEKDFFKLLNNSIFGKTIENKRKQVDVKLVSRWNDDCNTTNKCVGAEKLIARPNLKAISVFSENLVAIQLNKEKIILDRPIYVGFTVLEHAKNHLYEFHYDFIRKIYSDKAKLCYTDTDSLLYLINTDDVYEDIKDSISVFDTSNFSPDNDYDMPRLNAKIPGLFKDELGGDIMTEFVGLRAKLYCIKSKKTEIKKAKGVSRCITKRLSLTNYMKALHSNDIFRYKMNMIKSIKHMLYTQEVNKVVLSNNDDKRQIATDRIHTLPWGHANTVF